MASNAVSKREALRKSLIHQQRPLEPMTTTTSDAGCGDPGRLVVDGRCILVSIVGSVQQQRIGIFPVASPVGRHLGAKVVDGDHVVVGKHVAHRLWLRRH